MKEPRIIKIGCSRISQLIMSVVKSKIMRLVDVETRKKLSPGVDATHNHEATPTVK